MPVAWRRWRSDDDDEVAVVVCTINATVRPSCADASYWTMMSWTTTVGMVVVDFCGCIEDSIPVVLPTVAVAAAVAAIASSFDTHTSIAPIDDTAASFPNPHVVVVVWRPREDLLFDDDDVPRNATTVVQMILDDETDPPMVRRMVTTDSSSGGDPTYRVSQSYCRW